MTVYTAGYQGETISQFIKKLSNEDVDTVIDVRLRPFSRKPGFSKEAFQKKLNRSGIEYLHFGELGTPQPLRDFLAKNGDYEVFFEKYREFVLEYVDSLRDIMEMSKNKAVCIVCFEKDLPFCHRKVIVDLLNEYTGGAIKLIHL